MVVPEKVVVYVWDEAFVERGLGALRDVLVGVELELDLAEMGFGHAHRSKETPGHSEHVVAIVLTFVVAVEECLVVEVQDFEEEESVGVEQEVSRVVDIEF
jgi:hypothetical protein